MRGIGRLVCILVCVAMAGTLVPGLALGTEAGEVTKSGVGPTPPPGTIGSVDAALDGPPAESPTAADGASSMPPGTPSPAGGSPSGAAKDSPSLEYARSQVLVRFKSGVSPVAIAVANVRVGAATLSSFESVGGLHLVQLTGVSVERAITKYEAMPQVIYAEPNRIINLAAVDSDDSSYASQWYLKNTGQNGGSLDADIDADEAWSYETGSASTIVAVIDTGVDITHPDLVGNIFVNSGETPGDGIDNDGNGYIDDVNGWDTYGGSGDVSDAIEHGTHVAGIIGAQGNNTLGVTGVNWDVSILPVKAFTPWGYTYESDIIEAIQYASDMGADVVNCSWGWSGALSQSIYDTMAAEPNTLFVCAAGNGGADQLGDDNDAAPYYPSSFDLANVLAVGASDNTDAATAFSNYGATTVDVSAPGDDALSTIPSIQVTERVNDYEMLRDNFDSISDWAPDAGNNPGTVAWELSNANSWSSPTSMARLNYGNNEVNYMVMSAPLDLSSAVSPSMHFRLGYSLEYDYDYVYWGLYDAGDDTWHELSPNEEGLTGQHGAGWSTDVVADLSPWIGQTDIYPYVGITSDSSVSPATGATEYWGAWVDDFAVTAAFQDSFDTSADWSVYGNYGEPHRWVWDDTNGANGDPVNFGCWRANPYANSQWTSITQSAGMDLRGLDTATLDFWTYYAIESGWDYLWVQASTDGGSGWTTLAKWDGTSGGWSHRYISLNSLVGSPDVRIRFAFTSDSSVIYTGAWIDEVAVSAPLGAWQQTSVGRYEQMSGTSMAAAVSSGVAGLLLSRYPAYTTSQLKSAIMVNADPISGLSGLSVTGARVNAMAAFTALNSAPTVGNDSFLCDEDGSINESVTGNDSDAEGDPLTISLGTDVTNGALTLNSDGSFTYVPVANWNGATTFTYKAADGLAESVGTVTLTVNAVNDVPVAANDSAVCTEDAFVTVDVLANDGDVDLNALTTSLVTGPTHGAAVHNADGSFTYTPTADWYGTDTFTYVANDGTADSNTAVVTVDVSNTVGVADDVYNVQTNGTRVATAPGVLANENGIADSLSAILLSGPTHGALSFNADGSFIYLPDTNYVGLDSFTYKATDGVIETGVATVTLQVSPFGPPIDNVPGVVYRFYNLKSHAHFYTLSLEERDAVLKKYQGTLSYEGPAFWSFPAAGTIPVYRFYNPYSGSHFYTANEQEMAMVKALWPYLFNYEGTAFHIYTAPGAGRSPVYRFYNPQTGCHFYTVSEQERAYIKATWPTTWNEEGVGFWVMNGTEMP